MLLFPLDHLVIDVQDRMEEAAQRYRALGFCLTELGRHTLGSVNRLAVFETEYLELLGSGGPSAPPRPDLAGFPIGLNGLVFSATDPQALHAALRRRGLPAQPVQSFSRPVEIEGRSAEACFEVVRLEPRAVFDGRVYFCSHLTPDFVWRAQWQEHPSGAVAIARAVIAARDPDRIAAVFTRMIGHKAGEMPDGGRFFIAGDVRVEIAPQPALARALGDAMPDPAGRGDHMALIGLRVRSLARAEAVLRAGGIRGLEVNAGRIVVPAAEAMNTALEFSE